MHRRIRASKCQRSKLPVQVPGSCGSAHLLLGLSEGSYLHAWLHSAMLIDNTTIKNSKISKFKYLIIFKYSN